MTAPIRTGVLVWNQYTDWPAMRAAGQRIDALGYDSLWTWDHLYPIVGDIEGPFLEGYVVMAGWSQVTTGPTIGLMVGANTFRNPALVAKMVTTLDHLSDGRAVLGRGLGGRLRGNGGLRRGVARRRGVTGRDRRIGGDVVFRAVALDVAHDCSFCQALTTVPTDAVRFLCREWDSPMQRG